MLKKIMLGVLLMGGIGLHYTQAQDDNRRPITTAVPFLAITPDARSAAMGDAGVAISADANAIYWNPAKLVFIEGKGGFSLSYNPWLQQLVNDMSLSYLSGYYKLDNKQAFGLELRYFNLGDIQFTDFFGFPIRDFKPRELAFGATYSRKLSKQLSVAVSARYINSNLAGDLQIANQQESKPGNTGAADISLFYTTDKIKISGKPSVLSFGTHISNIGAKISYTDGSQQDFIPTNLRIGSALTTSLDDFQRNRLTFALDFNKLMVPSPPRRDSQGTIIEGQDPRDITLISGIFGSFADAPDGIKEEIQEFMLSVGLEYFYDNVFAARAGYFMESKNKGDRRHYTIGAGIRKGIFGLDVAYLIPVNRNNPLAETLRFTVSFNFKDKKSSQSFEETEEN